MKPQFIALLLATTAVVNAEDSQTKLMEPYAPKPSGEPPAGWEIRILEGSQVENSSKLANKREVKVTVPAYELVPTGKPTVIKDPKFDPRLATAQKETIGAVLTDYAEKASELEEKLGKIIGELEKALGKPEPKTNQTPSTKPETKPESESKDAKPDAKKKAGTPTR